MASTAAKLNYQISPIILTGGIAEQTPDRALPLISLFGMGPTSSTSLPAIPGDLDQAFGAFNVLPGGTLVTQSIGKYPFANQWVAANAVIREPLTISVIMDSPMRPMPGISNDVWAIKQSVFTSLKRQLEQHNNQGGMYAVATPAYIYTNLVMLNMTDTSRGNQPVPQNAWRFDFEAPLIALGDIQYAYSNFLWKISDQLPTNGQPTGPVPGGPTIDPTQARTIKAAGALVGGSGAVPLPTSGIVRNFPPAPPGAGFPYAGIS